ncbi:response regulator transcription factor [Flavonifractor hominis]|uniref:Stage 0 sporulation protein A homolog n=1 Tax=Flavonifractor hominis TaxID=3133178 RepID=A0ABV1EUM6_9FIRM
MSKAIVVVEDDESIREMLRYYFQSVGYGVRVYESGEALFSGEPGQPSPALYILDIMLPGMDGLEILRRLREDRDTSDIPVIMLTARSAEMDRVSGLESGADDYVVKPFGIMELQARVKAVLRRTERRGDRVLTWGNVEIDPAAREVRKDGKLVELTFKEFELLRLLCTRRGVALTRDEILQAVWDYDYTGETRTVDMHVKALRQKLGEDIITTVRGVGYKMS